MGAVGYHHIVCPTDFSSSAEVGLQWALSISRMSSAAVTVLHVIETVNEDEHELQIVHGAAATPALHSLVTAFAEPSDRVTELVAYGKPYREILNTASEGDADLIVIGVRGRGPVDLTLFGSTTNHVVRRATCPVMTIRSIGEQP
jgi:nucleotide-binding universal stress UspA family protein